MRALIFILLFPVMLTGQTKYPYEIEKDGYTYYFKMPDSISYTPRAVKPNPHKRKSLQYWQWELINPFDKIAQSVGKSQVDTTVDIGETWIGVIMDWDSSLSNQWNFNGNSSFIYNSDYEKGLTDKIKIQIYCGRVTKILLEDYKTFRLTYYHIGDYSFTRKQLYRTYSDAIKAVKQFLEESK